MSVLSFDCRFRYDTGFALNFQFDAAIGVTAIVGPSGSGKTTVLNLIAGLLRPHAGKIALHDAALFDSSAGINLPPERRGVGYVIQDFQLFPHLTVEENLRYGWQRSSKVGFEFEKAVNMLELAELLDRPPYSLSGGQKQRVAIGRAILRCPKLLLLDEPLNAVDAELRASITDYLDRIVNEFQIPTLLVSHDRASIAKLANTTVSIEPQGSPI